MSCSPGDALLYVLSAKESLSWPTFRNTVDTIHLRSNLDGHSDGDVPARIIRHNALSMLRRLGHCDVTYLTQDLDAICVAQPSLAVLPSPGLPRAVLCGRRSTATSDEVRSACSFIGSTSVTVLEALSDSFAPSCITVCASSTSMIQSVSDKLGIAFEAQPAAWRIAQMAGGIDDYLAGLTWQARPELDWPRRDFSPFDLGVSEYSTSDQYRLCRYTNPSTGNPLFLLWQGASAARVEPTWGRYAVLRASRVTALRYDRKGGIVLAPLTAPLPPLLDRALTMSAGVPPTVSDTGSRSMIRYTGVPLSIFEEVSRKIGQAVPMQQTPNQ